jgi:hypothetical protein
MGGATCAMARPHLQHDVIQPLRVTFLGFRKFDDLVSHYFIGNVAAIKKTEASPTGIWVRS